MGGYNPGPAFSQGSPYDQVRGTRRHKGVDFPAAADTPIPVAADGVVVGRGWHDDYGNMAYVKHVDPQSTDDKYSLYAHMPNLDSTPATGTTLTRGQTIGVVGTTGRSTGPHLHFELIILSPGTWWTSEKPWTGGSTGITGTMGRVDPLDDANWGGIDVYRGQAAVSDSGRNGAVVASLCVLDCESIA
jgi:murein DD-endopeptidase MepM/ murein hydrolase activator NlpD